MKRIILWGGTGQALVLAEFLPRLGFQPCAVFDNNPQVTSPLTGIPILHGRDAFRAWRDANPAPVAGLVAIGGDHGAERIELQEFLAANGVEIVTAVHPRAFVAEGALIGAGSQILAHSVVAAAARLGRGCIVNHNANVDHECVLADGVHLAPSATLCGRVGVGAYTLVGAGAVVLPRLQIGARTIVGAGAVVTRDLPDNVIATGNPARIIRARANAPPAT